MSFACRLTEAQKLWFLHSVFLQASTAQNRMSFRVDTAIITKGDDACGLQEFIRIDWKRAMLLGNEESFNGD